jgi:hypothetical protein
MGGYGYCVRLVRETRYARRYCGRPAGADGRCTYHRYRERMRAIAARRTLEKRQLAALAPMAKGA